MRARITVDFGDRRHSEVVSGTDAEIQRRVRALLRRYPTATVTWREEPDLAPMGQVEGKSRPRAPQREVRACLEGMRDGE